MTRSLRQLLLGVLSTLVATSCTSMPRARAPLVAPRSATGESYQLVFRDEFDGSGPLSPAHWSFETGFVRNQELQWYQPQNAVRRGGVLLIEGRREHRRNPRYVAPGSSSTSAPSRPAWANRESIDYTSASANTRGKHAWLYGRFEMRAKIDVRAGSWPAVWMLGTRGPWPANGEVDIMKFYHDTLLFNVAWGGANGATWNSATARIEQMPNGWAGRFHVWRMDWDETSIRLFLDDSLMNTQLLATTINALRADGQSIAGAPSNPFHEPAYLLMNLALGGDHGGDPAPNVPIWFEVDYVRVYQTPSQINATKRATTSPR